jgi:hypothetical protein
MKNLFKILIPCLVLALTSCYDTMDDKDTIDAKYGNDAAYQPTLTVAINAFDYQSINAKCTVSDLSNAVEVGMLLSNNKEFTTYSAYTADSPQTEFDIVAEKLNEDTTYYAAAYVLTRSGAIMMSNAIEVKTPKAPIFEVVGTYTATEFELKEAGLANNGSYDVTIAFAEGSTTEVLITNLWGGETTVNGTFDAATNTIKIANNQLLCDHPTHGPLNIIGVTEEDKSTDGVTLTFKPLGSFMKSSYFEALITTGQYAGYTLNYPTYVEMQHQ